MAQIYVPDEIVEAWNKVGAFFQKFAGPVQPSATGPAESTNTEGSNEVPQTRNEDGTWSAPEPEPVVLATDDETTGKAVALDPTVELSATAGGGVSAATHSELQSQVDDLTAKVNAQDTKLDAILAKLG